MNEELQALKPELEEKITAALTRRSMPNRGTFPPFRIPGAAKRLLEEIAMQQADIVIIDITGVSLIDTSTANHSTDRASK